MPYVRPKSMPVPSGIVARSTSRPAIPFTTSFSVPSPPTATTSVAPRSTAPRASSIRCSGRRLPVAPLSDAGLTRKTVDTASQRSVIGDGHVERDLRHAVDGGAQIVVRDPLELALDDDVADGEQASGLDAAQRT